MRLASFPKHEMIILTMKDHLPDLDKPIQKEMESLLGKFRNILSKKSHIKSELDEIRSDVFHFRIKALKWLGKERNIDFMSAINEEYARISNWDSAPKYSVLIENVLFAFRCNQRVVTSFQRTEGISAESIGDYLSELPEITLKEFEAVILINSEETIAEKVIHWVHSSLYMEMIILMTSIIHDESMDVSKKVINELAFLVADSAQLYVALAVQLGLLDGPSNNFPDLPEDLGEEFNKEQQGLAEAGLDDFAKNFGD